MGTCDLPGGGPATGGPILPKRAILVRGRAVLDRPSPCRRSRSGAASGAGRPTTHPPTNRTPLTSTPSPPLRREEAEFLAVLSAAFQRPQMYPGGHPTLDRAVDQVIQRVEPLLADRPAAIFAIGPTQFFVGDAASDAGHTLLRDLAGRLFRRNVGALRVARGVTGSELSALLQGLSPES